MPQRFQIEDMIAQDTSGVMFRALDTETGKSVTVRRFFPFGVDGGGLEDDEQAAYQIAVGRLAGLSHPALRSIVCGGCDPVDGIPFIATEWIDGPPLQSLVDQGPLTAELACTLLTQALEVCELLSQVFVEEAIWVETDLQSIIIGDERGHPFTFWISPFRWLGGNQGEHGLESIVALTERVMGWDGRIVGDYSGRGLGSWLKWLRTHAATATLKEARESLAARVGTEPPPAVERPVVRTAQPASRPLSSKRPMWMFIVLALMVGSASVGWFLAREASPVLPVVESAEAPPTPAQQASDDAAEFSKQAIQADRQKAAVLASQEMEATRNSGAIPWDAHELLFERKGSEVIVEGQVQGIERSSSGKTIYLLFGLNGDRNATRAAISRGNATTEHMIEKCEKYLGKTVHVSGKIKLQKISGLNRPDIMIDGLSAIRIVE